MNASKKLLFSLFLSFALVACKSDKSASPGESNVNLVPLSVYPPDFDFNNPPPGIILDGNIEEQEARVRSIMEVLVSAPCWDGSAVTTPGLGGSVGVLSVFTFYWRDGEGPRLFHEGFDTTPERDIILAPPFRTGTWEGFDFVVVQTTFTGDVEALVVYDEDTIAQIFYSPPPNATPQIVYHGRSNSCVI